MVVSSLTLVLEDLKVSFVIIVVTFSMVNDGSSVGSCIIHANILALFHGLQLRWDLDYIKVACFSDAAHVIDLIKSNINVHHRYSSLISAIKHLLLLNWDVDLTHTLREGNFAADYLARLDASASSRLVLQDAPRGMSSILLTDALSVAFTRH
ncbi:hypothetical protein P8452_24376 [Trifolium repens]|nr:hypothetical protein P8452_24376 [Trifolium repens]